MTLEQKLAKALELNGGYFSLSDVLAAIHRGDMQSFTDGTTWAVTRILDFPRMRVLELFMVVGTLAGLPELSAQIEEFAKSIGAKRIIAEGRKEWRHVSADFGWQPGMTTYYKELG